MRPSIRLRPSRNGRPYTTGPQRGRTPVLKAVQDALREDEQSGVLKVDSSNKTVSTPSASLPLSPIMDPDFLSAAQRFRTPKAKPSAQPVGRFRKLLAKNIYAQSLATPIRSCAITRARLPSSHLQKFRPVINPSSDNAWWMPADLVSSEATAETTTASAARAEGVGIGIQPSSRGPGAYVLLEESVLSTDQDKPAKRVGVSRRLMGARGWRTAKLPGGQLAVWREGMGGAVLDMLRNSVVSELLELAQEVEEEGKEYLLPMQSWEDAGDMKFRGCVLWSSPQETPPGGAEGEGEGEGAPGQYATLDLDVQYGSKVPVHNLHRVLGDEHLNRLRSESATFRDNNMVMLARVRTMKTQAKLWKIQGYLARSQTKSG
ncbi:uncharacterized protein DNG_01727 [Cephalotrichum gorgonifer]|uniref:Uncharacterized protein n=1 Tax=Cephalotrichum gorgonifer TaxID=2041049 RepID=A0AAE8MRE5_9PEZI|nr:uncharacterized protein DNG_01727 [Cephalotrichum gorgonifer]